MNIVIIGDGKVGFKLAKLLSEDEYDVTIIDSNENKLSHTGDILDIQCIVGDASSMQVQQEAGVGKSDITIACTSSDEINMLCCLIAKNLGATNTIARVRNPLYFEQMSLLKDDLKLTMCVNPELEAAKAMNRLITFPNANHVEDFGKGKLEILDYTIDKSSNLVSMSISKMSNTYGNNQLVVAVESKDEVFIPDGNYIIEEGDILHFVFDTRQIDEFFDRIGRKSSKLNKIMVCGGSRLAYYLVKELCACGKDVKIIEKDIDKCKELAELLPDANIILGDASNQSLLIEEGIEDADVFIGLTGMDEQNMISGLFAKQCKVKKVIVKVNEEERAKMLTKMGIESVLSPKSITANVIMSYVKARQKSLSSQTIDAVYDLVDGKVRAYEFTIYQDTKHTNIPLKDLKLKKGSLIAGIIRDNQVIIPDGMTEIRNNDTVIVVANSTKVSKIDDIFE